MNKQIDITDINNTNVINNTNMNNISDVIDINNTIDVTDVNNAININTPSKYDNITYNSILNQFIDIIEENKEILTSQQYINIYNKISPTPFNLSNTSDNALNTSDISDDAPHNMTQSFATFIARFIFCFFIYGGGIILYSLFSKSKFLSTLYIFNLYFLYVWWIGIIMYVSRYIIYPFLYKIYLQQNNN